MTNAADPIVTLDVVFPSLLDRTSHLLDLREIIARACGAGGAAQIATWFHGRGARLEGPKKLISWAKLAVTEVYPEAE
jgi:hypothetical protein